MHFNGQLAHNKNFERNEQLRTKSLKAKGPTDISVGLHKTYSWCTCKQSIVRADKNGFCCLESSLYLFIPPF